MPEISDEELQKMKTAQEQAEKLAREAQEAQTAHQREMLELRSAYEQQMAQVAEHFKRQAEAQQAAAARASTEALQSVEDLSIPKLQEMIAEGARSGVAPVMQQHYRNQADTNLRNARRDFPNFATYEAEVKAIMTQQSLEVQANPTAWEAAYRAACAAHVDDIVEQKVQERLSAKAPPPPEDEEVEEEEAEAATPAAPAIQRQAPAIAVASATGATSAMRAKRERAPRLDPEQSRISAIFGMTPEDYSKYSDPNYSPDIFGFRAPDGTTRKKV